MMALTEVKILIGRIYLTEKMLGMVRLKNLDILVNMPCVRSDILVINPKEKDEIGRIGYFFQFYEFYSTHYFHKSDLKGKVTSLYPRIII